MVIPFPFDSTSQELKSNICTGYTIVICLQDTDFVLICNKEQEYIIKQTDRLLLDA